MTSKLHLTTLVIYYNTLVSNIKNDKFKQYQINVFPEDINEILMSFTIE